MHVQADLLARMFWRFRRQNPTFRKKFRAPLRDLHVPDSGEADDDQSGGGGHDQGPGLLPRCRNQQPNVKFSSGLSQAVFNEKNDFKSYNRTNCSDIKFITEDTKVKHSDITTIYIDKTERYLQKLWKWQARRLGLTDLVVQLKVEGSASTFKREYLD